ncbi:MAG: glycosyltransferase [Candidatus Margulisbacteria bacterium]|nr:glycosyltransferase [Candidatus Margulisiibacteriota bacterium]
MKIKLVIFLYSLANWGGAEHIILKVCRYLQNTRLYDIKIIGLVDEQPSLEKDFAQLGITTKSLFYNDKKSLCLQLPTIFRLKKILKEEKPDILLNVLFPCIVLGGFIGKLAKVPIIIGNLHGPAVFKKKIAILLDRFVSRYYKGYIAVADHIKKQFSTRENIPENKISVIPNGIELKTLPKDFNRDNFRTEWGIGKNDIVIGTIGRTYREKNQEYLVEIGQHLSKLFPNLKVLIVGDGPLFVSLKKKVHDLGIENICILTGWQTSPINFLSIMDLFVLPSHYEGMPCSIIEAWQHKIPVAGTKVLGIQDLIKDNTTGILFPKDNPQQASDTLLALLKNRKLQDTLIINGYNQWHNKFSVEKMGNSYHNYFQNLHGQ